MITNRLHPGSNPERNQVQYSLLLQKMFKIPSVLAKRGWQKQKNCEKKLHEVQNHPKNEKKMRKKNFFQKNENFTAKIIDRHPSAILGSISSPVTFFLPRRVPGRGEDPSAARTRWVSWLELRWFFPTHRRLRNVWGSWFVWICFFVFLSFGYIFLLTPENWKKTWREVRSFWKL